MPLGPLPLVACEDDVRITDAQEALARALVELTALAEIAMPGQATLCGLL